MPKGVAFDHANAIRDALEFVNACHVREDDRLTLLYSPSVAGAVRDIYGALLTGATLHIIPTSKPNPKWIADEIRRRDVTVLHAVPVLFRRLMEASGQDVFESVRLVYLAGDRVDWKDVEAFRRRFPKDAQLLVGMGSTECATVHSQWFVKGDSKSIGPRVPVGRSLPDRHVFVLGENGLLAPIGEIGEIVMASRYAARGYWQGPSQQAVGFEIDNLDPTVRIVRTGDFGFRRNDGLLETVGRRDSRIKLSGVRIELAEVEANLKNCPGVAEAAVVVRRHPDGTPRALAGYVTLDGTHPDQTPEGIRQALRTRAPAQFVPAAVYVVDELPLLANLKLDRRELERMDAANPDQSGLSAPSTPTLSADSREASGLTEAQQWLTALWQRLLELETPPSLHDNFFELGGDSLTSAELVVAVEEKFGSELPLEAFFDCPTIAGMDALLKRHIKAAPSAAPSREGASRLLRKLQSFSASWIGKRMFSDSLLIGFNADGDRPPIFWVFQEYAEAARLAEYLGPDQPLYAMRSCVGIVETKDYTTEVLETVCNRYLWEILALPIGTEFIMGGNCQGGILALSMARRLNQVQRAPRLLALMEWSFSYGNYDEPILLIYGEESFTAPIYQQPHMSRIKWREDFPRSVVVSMPGEHGQFFARHDSISSLARILSER